MTFVQGIGKLLLHKRQVQDSISIPSYIFYSFWKLPILWSFQQLRTRNSKRTSIIFIIFSGFPGYHSRFLINILNAFSLFFLKRHSTIRKWKRKMCSYLRNEKNIALETFKTFKDLLVQPTVLTLWSNYAKPVIVHTIMACMDLKLLLKQEISYNME